MAKAQNDEFHLFNLIRSTKRRIGDDRSIYEVVFSVLFAVAVIIIIVSFVFFYWPF